MTEEDARAWFAARYDAATVARVERFADMVIGANDTQNLISPGTVATIWSRHIIDSAQLIAHAPAAARRWIDIGTGGGFPGMIVGLCWPGEMIMVDPRRRRATFLEQAAAELGLAATVHAAKVETLSCPADVISARAVASIEKLLQAAERCATPTTRWILPRGRNAQDETAAPMFHVEQSITDPESRIVLIDGMGR